MYSIQFLTHGCKKKQFQFGSNEEKYELTDVNAELWNNEPYRV